MSIHVPKGKDLLKKTNLLLATGALALTLNSCDGNQKKVKEDSDSRIDRIESVFNSDTLITEEKLAYFEKEVDSTKYKFLSGSDYSLIKEKEAYEGLINDYNKLESHKGDEVYFVHVFGVPTDYLAYFFSEEEQKKYLENIKEEINNNKREENDSSVDYAGPIGLGKTEKKVLDEETFKSIVEENAVNPLGGIKKQKFRSEKLRELQDKPNK